MYLFKGFKRNNQELQRGASMRLVSIDINTCANIYIIMYIKYYYTDIEQCLAHSMKCFVYNGLFNALNNPTR